MEKLAGRPHSSTNAGGGDLDGVENRLGRSTGLEQRHDVLDIGLFRLADDRADQAFSLGRGERDLILEQFLVSSRGLGRVERRCGRFLFEVVHHDLTGGLEERVPARSDGDVGDAGVEHVVCVVPADRASELNSAAGAEGLVSGGVGAVPEHSVLDVDQAGEHHLPEDLFTALGELLPEAEEEGILLVDLSVLDEGEPVVQTLFEGAVVVGRFLVVPVSGGRRGAVGVLGGVVGAPRVVSGHAALELVPDVESGRHVPGGLAEGEVAHFLGDQVLQAEGGAGGEEAVVVVDEADDAGVDPLVIGHVGVGGVGADGLGEDFGGGPTVLDQVEGLVQGRGVVALDDGLAVAVVGGGGLAVHKVGGRTAVAVTGSFVQAHLRAPGTNYRIAEVAAQYSEGLGRFSRRPDRVDGRTPRPGQHRRQHRPET